MRIITKKRLEEFIALYPDAVVPLKVGTRKEYDAIEDIKHI